MSRPVRLTRTPLFLPPDLLARASALALRYGSSRSEVVRMAAAKGLPLIARELRRLQQQRISEAGSRSSGRSPDEVDLIQEMMTAPEGVRNLTEYGRSVQTLGSKLTVEELRNALTIHARTLPLPLEDVDDVIAEAVAAVSDATSGGDAGGLPFDPSEPPA